MTKKYDITIAYRIYPGISKVPPIFSNDKLKLSELCISSFKSALAGLNAKVYFLLDNCPEVYVRLVRKYFDDTDIEIISYTGIGNAGTFKKQMEIMMDQNVSEYIYFAEDDYFYLPGTFNKMLDLIKTNDSVHFITPYYHLDYNTMQVHSDFEDKVIDENSIKWKSVATTTLTFLTKKEYLRENFYTFMTYVNKNDDASIWLSLTKHKVKNPLLIFYYFVTDKLWFKFILKSWIHNKKQIFFGKRWHLYAPIPSIATHMDSKCLPTGTDWQELFIKEQGKINFVS